MIHIAIGLLNNNKKIVITLQQIRQGQKIYFDFILLFLTYPFYQLAYYLSVC